LVFPAFSRAFSPWLGIISPLKTGYTKVKPGTINTILLIDGNLTESCMVDAVKTATEAKSAALREIDIRSHFSDELATGTITDSIIVACTYRGRSNMLGYSQHWKR